MKNLKLTFTNVDNLFDFVSCLQKEFTLFPAIQENKSNQTVSIWNSEWSRYAEHTKGGSEVERERGRERDRDGINYVN